MLLKTRARSRSRPRRPPRQILVLLATGRGNAQENPLRAHSKVRGSSWMKYCQGGRVPCSFSFLSIPLGGFDGSGVVLVDEVDINFEDRRIS